MVVEVKIEITGDIKERHRILGEICKLMYEQEYWKAMEGHKNNFSDALFHPKGTYLK